MKHFESIQGRWFGLVLSFAFLAWAPTATTAGDVLVAKLEGIISPISADYLVHSIETAESSHAECIVIELDTPGGLVDSTRTIIKKILISKVPVVVYVSPQGSHAASAGAYITMSAHVAAMAPGTVIGSAHPVSGGFFGSGEMDSNMSAKVTNDLAAYIRSLAEQRGRNATWAESAVRESVSLHETEALATNVIDLVATNLESLLSAIDGKEISLSEGKVTLHTKTASVVPVSMDWRDNFLITLGHPEIAYILFMLGLLGLYFELATPGAILPGVVGVISLVLAFFAFQVLTINFAGIALIVLAVVMFIIDIKAATHGALTIGGIAAMLIGSLMLFDAPDPALQLSLNVIIPVVAVTGGFFALGVYLSLSAMGRKPTAGRESLVGQEGDARTPVNAKGGSVFVAGAHWNALSEAEIPQGARVKVVEVKGMTLKVEVLPQV